MVQAFRHPASPIEEARFKLRGLDAKAQYAVSDLDVAGQTQFSGQELMEKGLPVAIKDQSGAVIDIYRRVNSSRWSFVHPGAEITSPNLNCAASSYC